MSAEKREYFQVHKSKDDIIDNIKQNIVEMLSHRIYISKDGSKHFLIEDFETGLEKLVDNGDNSFTVNTADGAKYTFKVFPFAVTSISKQQAVNDFLKDSEYIKHKKIMIVEDHTSKIAEYAASNKSELFKIGQVLARILDNKDQPRFEILSPNEAIEVKREYNMDDLTAPRILRSDPVVKYLGLTKGTIVRIIRGSPTSGETIYYRIVV
jgi:DNA-directed RNA polymerase subunit H (RpoH/RPB5)